MPNVPTPVNIYSTAYALIAQTSQEHKLVIIPVLQILAPAINFWELMVCARLAQLEPYQIQEIPNGVSLSKVTHNQLFVDLIKSLPHKAPATIV